MAFEKTILKLYLIKKQKGSFRRPSATSWASAYAYEVRCARYMGTWQKGICNEHIRSDRVYPSAILIIFVFSWRRLHYKYSYESIELKLKILNSPKRISIVEGFRRLDGHRLGSNVK